VAVHPERPLPRISRQQILRDSVRYRFEIRVEIESLESRECSPEIESVGDEVTERFVQIAEYVRNSIDLPFGFLLPGEPHRKLGSTDWYVVMHPFVKTE